VRALYFDIGETLADETRHWEAIEREAGPPRLTLLGVLGGAAARAKHHARTFRILGHTADELAGLRAERSRHRGRLKISEIADAPFATAVASALAQLAVSLAIVAAL
jgi:hypothetical protein